ISPVKKQMTNQHKNGSSPNAQFQHQPRRRAASLSLSPATPTDANNPSPMYETMLADVSTLLERARRESARSVNTIMTTTYWQIGRRIVEQEQAGEQRAHYGTALLTRLSTDLTQKFGRGFSADNLEAMRAFYLAWPQGRRQTILSGTEISETLSRKF